DPTAAYGMGETIIATAVAFVIGYAVIAWLMRFISRNSFKVFVWYRILLGAGLYVLLGLGVINASSTTVYNLIGYLQIPKELVSNHEIMDHPTSCCHSCAGRQPTSLCYGCPTKTASLFQRWPRHHVRVRYYTL